MKALKRIMTSFFRLCIRFKWVTLLVIVLMIAGTAAGTYYRQKQWEDSFDFALLELNMAIASGDLALLARRVDFNALSRTAAMDIMENMDATPVSQEGPVPPEENRRNPRRVQWLEVEVQKSLMKVFTEKPKVEKEPAKKEGDKKDEVPAEQRGPMFDRAQEALAKKAAEAEAKVVTSHEPQDPDTLKPPPLLPPDLITQLITRPLQKERLTQDSATAVTKVDHKSAHMLMTLRLKARKTLEGWKFTSVDGLGQIVRIYMDELRAFNTYRESLFHARNVSTLERMNRTVKILDCVAMLGAEQKDGTVTMIMRVEGTNIGDEIFSAASVQCFLYDEPEHEVLRQQFGLTNVVKPNDNFRIDYVQDFEADDPFNAVLRKHKTLTCVPQVMSITLQEGKLLYVKPFSAYTGTR